MRSLGRPLALALFCLCLGQARFAFAQDNPDNQPQIQPRGDAPAPKPHRKPKPQPSTEPPAQPAEQPAQPTAEPAQKSESSSLDSQIDLDAHPPTPEPALPTKDTKDADDKTLLPWDPHRADKDVEVGHYYLRLKNYRAALDRFNDALQYKQGDAEATYGLAVTQEKLDLLAQSYKNYQEYLRILPAGPHAKEAEEAMKRIGPHLDSRQDQGMHQDVGKQQDQSNQVEHDIDVGETYLSMNSFDAARERFEEAVRLEPTNAKACFRLAQSLQGLRRIEPAKLYYQKYLDLEPQGQFAPLAKKAIADINAFLK